MNESMSESERFQSSLITHYFPNQRKTMHNLLQDLRHGVRMLWKQPGFTAVAMITLLRANAQLGRVFGPQDQAQGFAEGVMISDGLWHRLFAADPNILGRKVYADSDLYTIIGVMPPGFRHPGKTLRNEVDMWA